MPFHPIYGRLLSDWAAQTGAEFVCIPIDFFVVVLYIFNSIF